MIYITWTFSLWFVCKQRQDCQLVLKVEDKDKLVGVTELGQCRIDLRELDLLPGWLEGKQQQQEKESLVRLSRFLELAKPEEKGAIFLGLSFLPTSQRITVQITQCNRLMRNFVAAAGVSSYSTNRVACWKSAKRRRSIIPLAQMVGWI